MSRRMLMLGLDSLDWKLLNEWAGEGRMPVLRKLLEESHALMFGESNRPLPGSVWTDIATGASAAVHGFIHEEQVAMDSYRSQHVDASRVAVAPFYKALSDAGVHCAVVDFPVDYPLTGFNGLQVIDWGTEFKLWHFETRPERLAKQLVSNYGKHPLTDYPGTRIGLSDLIALKHKLLRGIDIKQRFAIDLLRRNEHQFIFFNFAELHKAGHFFWKFHDRKHPEFTDAEPELIDSLRETYEAIDRAVGAVLAQLGKDDDLIVVTDRGMYADHRGDHLIDAILAKLGLAVPRGPVKPSKPSEPVGHARFLTGRKARALYRSVGGWLPTGVREALLPLHRKAMGDSPPLDWQRTRAYRMPSVGNTYVRINLAGRDPGGIVAAGANYDALLGELGLQLRALVNAETGEPAVEDLYFPGKLYRGPRAAELPDVAIVWNSNAAINAVTSPDIGRVEGRQNSQRSGNHRPEGFALFRGLSFVAGSAIHDGDARQLAPTILQVFGVSAPAHFEMHAPAWMGGGLRSPEAGGRKSDGLRRPASSLRLPAPRPPPTDE